MFYLFCIFSICCCFLADDADEPNPQAFDDALAIYKNDPNRTIPLAPISEKFVTRIVAFLNDGSRLELNGKIDLMVNNESVRSTAKLKKCPDGIWSLPVHDTPVTIIVYPEQDIFFEEEPTAAA